MIGVLQLQDINLKNPNIYNNFKHGTITAYNSVYLGQHPGHVRESNNINAYSTNDIVVIEYERRNEKVTVSNITKNTKSITYIQSDRKLPLYVGVMLNNAEDEVQLIDISCME